MTKKTIMSKFKISSQHIAQLFFLFLIVIGLTILALNLNEIRKIDEEIERLEQRELILIKDITEIEKRNTAEELNRLRKIENLERKELERLRTLN